jgi:hypothetical protein
MMLRVLVKEGRYTRVKIKQCYERVTARLIAYRETFLPRNQLPIYRFFNSSDSPSSVTFSPDFMVLRMLLKRVGSNYVATFTAGTHLPT